MAEKLVLAGKMPRGTFLVRKREGGEFALTINDSKEDSLEVVEHIRCNNYVFFSSNFQVKHYKIRPLDNGSGFFITTRKVFATVRDLIIYYSSLKLQQILLCIIVKSKNVQKSPAVCAVV